MSLRTYEAELFESFRGRLEAIAYRLLGSACDAEDAVQDTYLRWHAADRERIETPEAWLTKVLTNLCLNQLASARARRETYVGQWLPEQVLDGDRMLGPADTFEQRESVSMAMLTLMEAYRAPVGGRRTPSPAPGALVTHITPGPCQGSRACPVQEVEATRQE
ncbi:sigma factor [Nonomuraea coxensis]